jgi:protoporphyrinogen oxidase
VSGIFAGDIKALSVKSVFRMLWDLEEHHGSVVKGMFVGKGYENPPHIPPPSDFVKEAQSSMSVSFRRGLQQLPDALTLYLQQQSGVELHTNWPVGSVELSDQGKLEGVTVRCASDPSKAERFDVVFSTLSAQSLAQSLKTATITGTSTTQDSHHRDPQICEHLDQARQTLATIRSSSVASISLGYNDGVLPYDGFGYLIPSFERLKALGVIFDSHVFPAQNNRPWHTRLTVMAGGMHHPNLLDDLTHDELVNLAQSTVKAHLNIKKDADIAIVNAHRHCIPQYEVGHSQRLKDILHGFQRHVAGQGQGQGMGVLAHHPVEPTVAGMAQVAARSKLYILGNSFWGVGISDCVATAQETVALFAAQLSADVSDRRRGGGDGDGDGELRRKHDEIEAKMLAMEQKLADMEARVEQMQTKLKGNI